MWPASSLPARWRAFLAVFLVVVWVTPLGAGVAHAEDGYRFWGYYQRIDNEWRFSEEGSGTYVPEDGGVEGWRHAVAGMNTQRPPRATPAFNEICGKVRPQDGSKRVAVVVDPGTPEDAPDGQEPGAVSATCVVAPPEATGTQVLQLAREIRTDDSGMVCGIAGFPAQGCGDPVANISVPAQEEHRTPELTDPAGEVDSAVPVAAWIGIGVLVVALITGAVVVGRRRSA